MGAEGSIQLSCCKLWGGEGGSHLLVIMSLGPAPPPGQAMPADVSVEQLQFVCELLIPRGELGDCPREPAQPPSAQLPRGLGADQEAAYRPATPDFARVFRWL